MNIPSRSIRRLLPAVAALLVFILSAGPLVAQNSVPESGPTWSQQDTLRIAKEVQKRLLGLTNYNVFDWLTYGMRGKSIVLQGYASRPILKNDAANAVKRIPGVESVDNQIEVLPTSMMDDRVRGAVYNHIYTQPALRRYNANQGTARQAIGPGPSVARMAAGITADPPRGYHAIHIIVKNGNVTLFGIVGSQSDAAIAEMQAKSTPGTFSVVNNLIAEQGAKPASK